MSTPSARSGATPIALSPGAKLGTFAGVFTPSVLTILGIILFLRLGFVVGAAGLPRALLIIAIANLISVLTSLSLAAIATNMRVRGGGDYYLISRTLGMSFGGAIGIVLFLAQAISVAFYAIGFGEAMAGALGRPESWFPQAVALPALAVLFVLAWVGADVATRFQYIIMAVLFAALASFFVGAAGQFSGETFAHSGPPASTLPFWAIFAIFFPAVTGFTQGVSMSGDLENPGKSIPVGTFLAVGLSAIVYFAVAILFAGSMSTPDLAENVDAMRRVSRFARLADAGVMAATFSSALASFLGAPRILQSLARDRIFPGLGMFAKGHGTSQNPRAGIVLAGVLAVATVALGKLDAIAPVVSMFFLISYGLLNFATYFEARAKSPSFRPRFRFFDQRLSLLGGVGCLGIMFALNAGAGFAAMIVMFAIYNYVKRRAAIERWADSSRSIRFQEVRQHLFRISDELEHARDWRPVLLTFSDNPARRERILRFASWIEGGSGLTTVVQFIEGEGAVARRARDEALRTLRAEVAKLSIEVFPLVVTGRDVDTAIPVLIQSHGLGPIRPNTVLLNWWDRTPGTAEMPGLKSYGHYLRLALLEGCNLVVLETNPEDLVRLEAKPLKERRIDVWDLGDATGRLTLLLAYLMTRTKDWEQATIRLCIRQEEGEDEARAMARAATMLDEVRIVADVHVVTAVNRKSIVQASAGASFIFLPFRMRGTDIVGPDGNDVDELLDILPLTSLVLATQDIDLDAQPEEGVHAEIAEAADAKERASLAAENAEHELKRAHERVESLKKEIEKLRTKEGAQEELEALETKLRAAAAEIEKWSRRMARAEAKAEAGESAVQELLVEGASPPASRKPEGEEGEPGRP